MSELKLLGLFLGILVVVSMALSRQRPLRLLGLSVLLLVAIGGLVATVGLVALAIRTARDEGLARYGLLFLSIPVGLITWLAFRFFAICRDIDPQATSSSSPLAGLVALAARLRDRAS